MLSILPGCQTESTDALLTLSRWLESEQPVLTVDSKILKQKDIDKSIATKIYDLELAQYHLRKAQIKRYLSEASENDYAVDLPKPVKPLITLPKGIRSTGVAPKNALHIALVCSFQSLYCKQIQTDFDALLGAFPGHLVVTYYDFPLAYHRYDKRAAVAGRCAAQFGQLRRYSQLLYEQQYQLAEPLFLQLADKVGIDRKHFEACQKNAAIIDTIEQEQQLLQAQGINRVPVLFIAGRYTPFPFDWLAIKGEIAELIAQTMPPIAETQLPLKLYATIVAEQPVQADAPSIAVIGSKNSARQSMLEEGDVVLPRVWLSAILTDRVLLVEGTTLRYLRLNNDSDGSDVELAIASLPTERNPPQSDHAADETRLQERFAQEYEQRSATLTLEISAKEILAELDEKTFKQHFDMAEHQVEGLHLLRLKQTQSRPLFSQLGLKENDVILRVLDEWVHEQNNPLYDVLKNGNDFRLALIRKGLPVVIDYRISDDKPLRHIR